VGARLILRFRIPARLREAGVYLICVNGQIRYVGECDGLSHRFDAGYGQISPRNCYMKGQSTNCKINHLILETTRRGLRVKLYFLPATDRKRIEQELRNRFRPSWNGR